MDAQAPLLQIAVAVLLLLLSSLFGVIAWVVVTMKADVKEALAAMRSDVKELFTKLDTLHKDVLPQFITEPRCRERCKELERRYDKLDQESTTLAKAVNDLALHVAGLVSRRPGLAERSIEGTIPLG
jgi:hypothetical protein